MLEIDLNLVELADMLFRKKHTDFLAIYRMPTVKQHNTLIKDS